jgi:hypothetical protein
MCFQNDYAHHKKIEDLEKEIVKLKQLLAEARADGEHWRHMQGKTR